LSAVPEALPAAAPFVRREYLTVVHKSLPAAPLVVFAGTWPWCPGRCRGAATLLQQGKNNSVDVQRKRVNFTRL